MNTSNLDSSKNSTINNNTIINSNNTYSYELTFSDLNYFLTVINLESSFKIVIEDNDYNFWIGSFDSNTINKLTTKVQSYKDYFTFYKMIIAALNNSVDNTKSQSCCLRLDLLDKEHIEKLKANYSNNNSLNTSIVNNTCRTNELTRGNKYLILTMQNEFEIKHYPLVLEYNVSPHIDVLLSSYKIVKQKNILLKNKIKDLENNTLVNNNDNISLKYCKSLEDKIQLLSKENTDLKNKTIILESQRQKGAVYTEDNTSKYLKIKSEYELFLIKHEEQIKKLNTELESKNKEIENLLSNKTTNEIIENFNIKINELTLKNKNLNNDIIEERVKYTKLIEDKKKDIINLKSEIINYKENEKNMKVKLNKLNSELDKANNRNTYISKLNSTPRSSINSVSKYNKNNSKNINNSAKKSNLSVNSKSNYSKSSYNKSYTSFNSNNSASRIKNGLYGKKAVSNNNINLKQYSKVNYSKEKKTATTNNLNSNIYKYKSNLNTLNSKLNNIKNNNRNNYKSPYSIRNNSTTKSNYSNKSLKNKENYIPNKMQSNSKNNKYNMYSKNTKGNSNNIVENSNLKARLMNLNNFLQNAKKY